MKLETKLTQKYPLLGSSEDPEKVALSIKGVLLLLVPVLVAVFKLTGLELPEVDLIAIINNLFLAFGTLFTVYGIVRKILKR